MAMFNYAAREVTSKVVYYGPGLSGKTTSIQYMHSRIGPGHRGKLVSLATETDRTLFFDFFPVEFGKMGPYKIKFNFYTVPGQVFYNATRKLVLKGVDGVVFVADSHPDMMPQNLESLENLKENLLASGVDWESVPFVIQYNKRDMPGSLPVEEMRTALNQRGAPDFETIATSGAGVMEAMKAVCSLVIDDYRKTMKASAAAAAPQARGSARSAGEAPQTTVASLPPGAPQPAVDGGGPPETASGGAERRYQVPLRQGLGASQITLTIPLDLHSETLDAGAELAVTVRAHYVCGTGQIVMRDLALGPPANKGFWARLFGRG
ncbi:MAG: GTPase domain-containing protein [Deltaproteobacteria bacterium]|nr:GTPase domain-containing protein [Deltaproteobacteria bacterium]